MNKFFTKIAGLTLGLAMAIGVGVALGSKSSDVKRAEADTVFYTLTCTQNSSNTGYASTYDVTINNLKWNAPGNQSQGSGWRIGGNSITNVDRIITGKSKITSSISKITVNHYGKSANAVTVNSVKVTVSSTSSFGDDDILDDVTVNNPTIATSTNGSFDFTPTSSDWAANSYYKFTFNITKSSSGNAGIDLGSFVFYAGSSGGGDDGSSGKINFGTATGSTNINTTSITENDDCGNEWTITTTGTTSFTGSSTYSQIGSSKSPASNITFTTTLSSSVKFTSFSAKFGGFSDTAGSIYLKVGSTTVASGSLNATSDVTVTTPNNYTGTVGTTLTVLVGKDGSTGTAIAKGVKAYWISYAYEAADSISSLTVTNPKTTFTVGDPFTHVKDNTTEVTATYATAGAKTVTSGFTYTLGGVAVTTSYTMAKADNGKTVVVTYTDSDGLSKAADGYAITVNYENLDDDELTMTEGPVDVSLSDGTVKLTAEVTNPNADPTIAWSSGDTNIATVDQTGLVTLKAAGNVDITASADNNKVSKTCTVRISATPTVTLDVTSISDKYTGDPDVTITPTVKNVPNDAVYIWTSTNTNVATVTKGTGNVGIVHFEGTSSQNESITLTIKNAAETETLCSASAALSNITKSEVRGLTLSKATHTLYDGKFVNSFTLVATIADSDVIGNANKNITWTSSDENVATVDENGVVTAKPGIGGENVTTTIRAASSYTPTVAQECIVTVLHDTVTGFDNWNGRNTPSSFYTGDVLEDVSNWTFDVTWASGGKETSLSWGTGSNVVHLNKCAVGVNPTTETDNPLDTDYEVVIGDNNKRLVPFYGEFAGSAKVMNVNQSAVSDIEISLDDRIVDNKLDMYDTEELTLDYTVTYVGNVDDGVNIVVSDENKLDATDNGTDGHGHGKITISGQPCTSVTLTVTSKDKNSSDVSTTIDIHIIADEVLSLSWTGSGVADVLEYESATKTLGETLDSSNWSFTATWNKKVESDLTVGSGADNVNLGIFNTDEPSAYSEGTAYNASAKLDTNLNGKYLVAFYKGARAEETIKLEIVDVLEKISIRTPREVTEEYFQKVTDISQIDSTTPFLIVGYNSYSSSYYAFNGNLTSLDGAGNLVVIGGTSAIVNGRIEATTALKNATFTYDSSPTSKALKSKSGYYIGNDGTSNGLSSSTTTIYENTISCSTSNSVTTTTIKGKGGLKLQLMKSGGDAHASSSQFKYYKSAQTDIEIYKYVSVSETVYDETVYSNQDIDVQKQVVNFARYLNETMAVEGVCGSNEGNYGEHTTSALLTAWQKVSAKYAETVGSLTGDDLTLARNMIKNASAHWNGTPDVLQRAMATYDFVILRYSSELIDAGMTTPNFITDGSSPLRSASSQLNMLFISKNTSATIIVVVISAISAAAIGGYFLFRKKKED